MKERMDSCQLTTLRILDQFQIYSQSVSHLSYHQKIPEELPELPKKEVYGLATPEDFSLPPHHQLWTEELYKSFEVPEGQKEADTYDTQVYTLVKSHPLIHRLHWLAAGQYLSCYVDILVCRTRFHVSMYIVFLLQE